MVSQNPEHIAIILDGNRRYAKRYGLRPWRGHDYGMKKLQDLLEWLIDTGAKELTLYCFSTENFKRPKQEIDYLMKIFKREFDNLKDNETIYKNKVKLRAIGKIELFPKEVIKSVEEIEERTKDHDKFTINFALGYGGRAEITDSFRKIAEGIKDGKIEIDEIDEDMISENLYLSSEPDMIIRPGGEKRISNFLIWQGNYAELFFIDKLWPEFTKEDLESCIKEYKKKDRRKGK